MAQRSLKGDVKVEFTEAASRQGIDSGESVKTLFGKIRKWLSDLKAVAFSGSYNDLDNKPTIPPAVAVKGNAEAEYRTGNVNLTAANIGLGNVNNTSDADKPISTATQAALNSQQERINYNTNNGVKNLISTEWFIIDNHSTIESRNDKTGSLTGSAPASASATYIQTYIPEDIVNSILENGKTYILSWNVDSRTNNGIFGIRKATGVYTSSSTLNRTGSYSVSYTHDSSVPVFISLCINTSATSAVKRIALSNIMLREATVEDSTFQPYAKSNAELTRYTDYVEISQDEDNHTDIISIGATKQLDIVHNDYYLENEIILKGPNVYLPGSAEIVTAGKRAEISLATGAAEVKLVANTDSSNTPYLYLQSGVIPYISIQPNSNKMQFITDANGTQKIAIDTNGVHIASGGTVFEVKSDGVYINGTKIGG